MKLNFNIEQFEPVDSNVVIQPGPVKKINTVDYSVKGGNPGVDVKGKEIKEVDKTYSKLPTQLRIGKILAIASDIKEPQYKVGDWVVYKQNGAFITTIDLVAKKSDDDKCPIVMKAFGILCKVNIEE